MMNRLDRPLDTWSGDQNSADLVPLEGGRVGS